MKGADTGTEAGVEAGAAANLEAGAEVGAGAGLDAYGALAHLRVERRAHGVLLVTMDRPEVLNAADVEMHRALADVWRIFDADAAARVAVITGAGRGFCAGADLSMAEALTGDWAMGDDVFRDARMIVENMLATDKPIVSAINGVAVGAGLAVALMADISIAAESARFTDGHLRFGVVAGDHAVVSWPLLCGIAKAKYYLLTGEFLDGREAERIGLVSACVPDGEVLASALDVAERLATGSQPAIRFTKRALNHWYRAAMPAFEHSAALEWLTFLGPDAGEGLAALKGKRPPVFG